MSFDHLTLALVRHYPTKDDVENRISSPIGDLTPIDSPAGLSSIEWLIDTFGSVTVWHSTAKRAKITAENLASVGSIGSAVGDQRLNNINVPGWVGKLEAELTDDPGWNAFLDHPSTFRPVEGESVGDVMRRTSEFLRSLKEGTHLIVSHTTPLQSILLNVFELGPSKLWITEFKFDALTLVRAGVLEMHNVPLDTDLSGVSLLEG